jgi:hypothetical protein
MKSNSLRKGEKKIKKERERRERERDLNCFRTAPSTNPVCFAVFLPNSLSIDIMDFEWGEKREGEIRSSGENSGMGAETEEEGEEEEAYG